MPQQASTLTQFADRWGRSRRAIALLMLLATGLLLVSEVTYHDTTATLRGGIALTDARLDTLALFQNLTDIENAELNYLATGQTLHLMRLKDIQKELPQILASVISYFKTQGTEGAAVAQHVTQITARKISQFDQILLLAGKQQLSAATALVTDPLMRLEMGALKTELSTQLARAKTQQQQARTSIYDALLINRVAIAGLTGLTVLCFFLIFRQLRRQDEASNTQAAYLIQEHERLDVEVKRRTAQLAELAKHLQTAIEDERARLARELHDELGSLLTVCKLEIARARAKINDPEAMQLRFERMNEYLNKGIALKRKIIEDLRPSSLADLGLTVALENLCSDMSTSLGTPVKLITQEVALSPEAALAVYRFVQEALTNIGKYAKAHQVHVSLQASGHQAVVQVQDDGVGFSTQAARTGHHGLAGMQFRAESMGGAMHLTSAPGQGTTVRIEFPQSNDADDVTQLTTAR